MTMSENPAIALIGPGAIGTTVAAALHEVGRTPTIFGRSAHEHLELRFDATIGEFALWCYGTHRLPICPLHYEGILGDEHYGL